MIAAKHSQIGSHWSKVIKFLPGRTENSIKNHWNATHRSKVRLKTLNFFFLLFAAAAAMVGWGC